MLQQRKGGVVAVGAAEGVKRGVAEADLAEENAIIVIDSRVIVT